MLLKCYIDFVKTKRPRKFAYGIVISRLKQVRYYKEHWRYYFKENGLITDRMELRRYFEYQKFRFRSVKFVPHISVLFNKISFDKYKEVRSYIHKYIGKEFSRKESKKSHMRGVKELKLREETNLLEEERFKKQFIKSKHEATILEFCISNYFYFELKSNICQTCNHKTKCKKRNIPKSS